MAEARANPLLGGYDEEFVNEVEDELQCAICQLPLNEPMLTKCGHRFCRRCIDEHFKRLENDRKQFSCPVDRISLLQYKDIFADKATERKILSLIIKCGNRGCQWTGELRSKENHLASCPMAIISCPYDQVGCTTKFQRKEVEFHLQYAMRLHLDLTFAKLKNMEGEFKETTRKLEENFGETKRELEKKYEEVTRTLEGKVNVLEKRLMQFSQEYTWKIIPFSRVYRQARNGQKTFIWSPPFYYFGYKFKLELCPNGKDLGKDTHLSLYFHLLKGEYDARLSWPFQGILKFTLIDLQEDAEDSQNINAFVPAFPQDSRIVERPLTEVNVGWGLPRFVSLTKLTERRYVVDDKIVIQVQVVPE